MVVVASACEADQVVVLICQRLDRSHELGLAHSIWEVELSDNSDRRREVGEQVVDVLQSDPVEHRRYVGVCMWCEIHFTPFLGTAAQPVWRDAICPGFRFRAEHDLRVGATGKPCLCRSPAKG